MIGCETTRLATIVQALIAEISTALHTDTRRLGRALSFAGSRRASLAACVRLENVTSELVAGLYAELAKRLA